MTIAILGIFGFDLFDTGSTVWRETAEQLRARGEPLDLSEVAPTEAAEANNFFAAPVFANWKPGADPPEIVKDLIDAPLDPAELLYGGMEIADWAAAFRSSELVDPGTDYLAPGDVVRAGFRKLKLDFAGLHEATLRGESRFPVDFEAIDPVLPHLAPLDQLAKWIAVDAVARLSVGDNAGAERAVFTIFRLAQALAPEPLLASQAARRRIVMDGVAAIRFGLETRGWSAAELTRLNSLLAGIDLSRDYIFALRGERARINALADVLVDSTNDEPPAIPTLAREWLGYGIETEKPGDIRRKQAAVNLAIQLAIDGEPQQQEIAADPLLDLDLEIIESNFTEAQTAVDEARLAAAQEQFRIRNHRLPESNEEVLPELTR